MENNLNLIVMLTHNDLTVNNAYEIFEECKNSKAKYWGFKEHNLPIEKMRELFQYMKKCGKKNIFRSGRIYGRKGTRRCQNGIRMWM